MTAWSSGRHLPQNQFGEILPVHGARPCLKYPLAPTSWQATLPAAPACQPARHFPDSPRPPASPGHRALAEEAQAATPVSAKMESVYLIWGGGVEGTLQAGERHSAGLEQVESTAVGQESNAKVKEAERQRQRG